MVDVDEVEDVVRAAPGERAFEPTDNATWVSQRRPVVLAFVLIVTVTLAGWGLKRWGPLNPEVQVVSFTRELPMDHQVVALEVENRSLAPLDITDLRLVPETTLTNGGMLPDIVSIAGSVGDLTGTGATLPLTVPAGGRATVSAQLETPGCQPGRPVQPFHAVISIRTLAGRTMEVTDPSGPTSGSCGEKLPSGTPPADPAGATAAVTTAYATVYDATAPKIAKGVLIDDPHGLDVVTESARGTAASAISTVRAKVTEVSFDRPDHAWVRYDLTGANPLVDLRGSIGEAVLIDGRWKVTRTTICRDLALASVICPP